MQLVLDILYVLFVITCLVLVYLGCQQDLKSTRHVQKNYKASIKEKFSENEKKYFRR